MAVAEMAELTPEHADVPYVQVNGVALEGKLSSTALVDAVCRALPAARRLPAACAALISPPPPLSPPPLAPPPRRRSGWLGWLLSILGMGAVGVAAVYVYRQFRLRRGYGGVDDGVAVPLAAAAEYVAH